MKKAKRKSKYEKEVEAEIALVHRIQRTPFSYHRVWNLKEWIPPTDEEVKAKEAFHKKWKRDRKKREKRAFERLCKASRATRLHA